jgi:hypothetical protein
LKFGASEVGSAIPQTTAQASEVCRLEQRGSFSYWQILIAGFDPASHHDYENDGSLAMKSVIERRYL